MGIKKLKTGLKSLPYPNEGIIGEPYIIIPISEDQRNDAEQFYVDQAKFASYDIPVRGGTFSVVNSVTDVLRISKFLVDWPRGPLFLINQEGLQLSNPLLEPQHGIDIKDPNQDTRLYNLGINTLAQIGTNPLGIHFMRHGLFPEKSISVYEDLVGKGNSLDEFRIQVLNLGNPNVFGGNRLLDLFGKNILNSDGERGINDNAILYRYNGGPNSKWGLGETVLNRYINTTKNVPNKDGANDFSQKYEPEINYLNLSGSSAKYGVNDEQLGIDKNNPLILPIHLNLNSSNNTYQSSTFNIDTIKIQDPVLGNAINFIQDFRKTIALSQSISIAYTDYSDPNINLETRVNKGNPGKLGVDRTVPWKGTGDPTTGDTINKIPLYTSQGPLASEKTRDLIKFRFKALNNDKPGVYTFIHFRAYLSGISDSNSGEWDSFKYNGRGEKFYTYQGFDRKISFSFKIHPQSREEMKPLYQKLNFLISNTAPDYNINGFMRGPLVQLNIGDYISDQTGFINSIGISIPDNGTWEIAMQQPEGTGDVDMQELPKYIEVNVQFTPIHNFVPKKGYNVPFITDIDKENINNFLRGDIVSTNEQDIINRSSNSLNESINSSESSPPTKRRNNQTTNTDNKGVTTL